MSASDWGTDPKTIIDRLRRGETPDDQTADVLNRIPLINGLRQQVADEDLDVWIWPGAGGPPGSTAAMYISLLRPFSARPDVQERLRHMWEDAEARHDAFTRVHLLFRLLDAEDLPDSWHRRILQFILDEWAVFRATMQFMGTSENLILEILKRLGDPTFPETKKWIYLCRLPLANDRAAAKALLDLVIRWQPGSFSAEVAALLLGRFWPVAAVSGHAAASTA